MNSPKILSSSIAKLPFSRSTQEIIPYITKWLEGSSDRTVKKAARILEMSEVDMRHSIMPIEEVFTERSFEEKNNNYILEMKKYSVVALKDAIDKAGIRADELDAIISVSCTGFMIPSIDAYLVNELRLRQDIMRLPVTEMGCAGGTSSLIYAHQYLKANPGKKVAVIALESPTSTFQHHDKSMTNIVSSALFGDGISALILGSTSELKPEIIDSSMFHFYDEEEMMGFQLINSGLKMILSTELPNKIEDNFEKIYEPFIHKNKIELKDIKHLMFHPGGKKIIKLIEEKFDDPAHNLDVTRNILRKWGNMSSATIFFVIDEYLKMKIEEGDLGLMLSFGPGFTAQLILVRWTK